MDELKFKEAKKLQEKINTLKFRQRGFEEALKACSISAVLTYSTGSFSRKNEVSLYDKEGIDDLIKKEYDSITLEILDLEKEFKNL
jgi:SpoVK/Ycf46/Vps4 family AAA+-type ATPase